MQLTSENKKGIISHIKSAILSCDDLGEIVVNSITDYDMEFNKIGISYVDLAHCFIDKGIVTLFTENININHIRILMVIYDTETNKQTESILDVSCKMKIVKLRYHGNPESVSNCFIRLEGFCE